MGVWSVECCGCGVLYRVECLQCGVWSDVGCMQCGRVCSACSVSHSAHGAWPQCVIACVPQFGSELARELQRVGVTTRAASADSSVDALQQLMKQRQQELDLESERLEETITDASVHAQARQGELNAVRSN